MNELHHDNPEDDSQSLNIEGLSGAPLEEIGDEEISRTRVPFAFAQTNNVIIDEESIFYTGTPSLEVLAELRRHCGKAYDTVELDEKAFTDKLSKVYQSADGEAQQAAEDMGAEFDLSALAEDIPEDSELLTGDADAPVIRLINAILSQAVQEQASDIHVEPFEDRVSVRFRIDGVMKEVLSPKAQLGPVLVSRLKVMARLDIAEKRIPQDGRITVKLAGHAVDIRVSTMPSAHGERTVLRILDQSAGALSLEQLNMPQQVLEDFKEALAKPHGIILVTGPTGSGKTTSLYSGLSYLNSPERNILTVEDPVEYLLPGIGQTQVNNKVDMTFVRGLRAILRQDPDVVMIGEIRDKETASIAVQASLTGHLLLSTLHTNTAIGAVTRLGDLGIEPFLLSSSLEALIAQRLVRVLCKDCKEPYETGESEEERVKIPAGTPIYRANGCEKCHFTGYRGRTGIYELIPVDDELRQLIHEGVGEQQMLEHARTRSRPIDADGRDKVLVGITSVEELLRVTVTT